MTGPILYIARMDCRRKRLRLVREQIKAVTEALSSEGKIEGDLAAARFTDAVAKAGESLDGHGRYKARQTEKGRASEARSIITYAPL